MYTQIQRHIYIYIYIYMYTQVPRGDVNMAAHDVSGTRATVTYIYIYSYG